jgi:polyvinyl alcohol dehydrogenase (cytochrome)
MDSGKQIWQVKLNDHPELTITGSPSLHADTLYVPMSSREWATAAAPDYQCCSFRGGVVALNINNGERRWTTYTVNKPTQTNEKNAFGTPFLAPSGAPVWNSPTIDVKRGLLYVGTGENYSSPASEKSDAVVAIELSTGAIKWFYQSIKGDAWNMSCLLPGGTNCPKEKGPDFDIGASVVLHTLENGKDILLVGQKSGHVFALDPDKLGALIWKKKIGRGGFLGGIHWGMTAQNNTLYAPIADTILFPHEKGASFPGLFYIDALTGKTNWYMETKNRCKKEDGPGCDAGLSASVSSIDGVVFAGGLDGYFYAVDTKDGSVLWEFNTNKRFQTVSGETAKGGSIESDGAVIIDGHVLVNSGYSFGGRMPGNVLLVFTVDGK